MKLHLHFSVISLLCSLFLFSSAVHAKVTDYWKPSNESNTATIDHHAWQTLLQQYLKTDDPSSINLFRYAQVNAEDKAALKSYLQALQAVDIRNYRRAEQMAYWINLYNAATVNLILDNYPVKSIKKLGKGFFSFGPWDDTVTNITGQDLSLNDIEHKILRPIWKDPRIHYAVNCASLGCPNLAAQAYTADNLDSLLNQGAVDYINHPRGVNFNAGKLTVSSIFHWYAEDFGNSEAGVLQHLARYAGAELKQQLAQHKGSYRHEYDWNLNAVK